MFDDIYDNGCVMLGKVRNIKDYLAQLMTKLDYQDDARDILEDLKDMKDDIIVAINYDNPMGYNIEYWEFNDRVKEDFYE